MAEQPLAPLDEFKEREIEILTLMAEGMSNREIADKLVITVATVRWYNKQIYSKLGTSRRTEAVKLGREYGLIGGQQPSPSNGEVRRNLLPALIGSFIGRQTELEETIDLLQKADVRLLSIVAVGGMGKTRLAVEIAHQLVEDFEHGAVFVDLTCVQEATRISGATLASLKIPPNDQQNEREVLFQYCRDKHLLLVFDNMEHLLDEANLLADLLKVAPNVKLIVTSRYKLNLHAETVYYLQPLQQDAGQLFIQTAARMQPDVHFVGKDLASVERIVQLVGGMPLALILAATWMDTLSVQEITQEIEQGLDFLAVELWDMPKRQRSIYAVLDPTWNQLSAQTQLALMKISVCRGGFTRELFSSITAASVRVLQVLVRRSLLMSEQDQRYGIHPIIREYAQEKLRSSEHLTLAKSSHIAAVLKLVVQQNEQMFRGEFLASLRCIQQDQDNIRAALEYALESQGQDLILGAQVAIATCEFWDTSSYLNEAQHYLSAFLERVSDPALTTRLQTWRSRFRYHLGDIDAARTDAENALVLAEALGDDESVIRSLVYLSHLLPHQQSRPFMERAVRVSEAYANRYLLAKSLNSLGIWFHDAGDWQKALQHYQQSQHEFEAVGDLQGISRALYNIGLLHENKGNIEFAQAHYKQSLELKRQMGDRAGIARRLAVIAFHQMAQEEFEEARTNLHESRLICEAIGDRVRWTYTIMGEGILYFISNQFEDAISHLRSGIDVVRELQQPMKLIEYHNLLGMIYLAKNDLDGAQVHLFEALKSAKQCGRTYGYWLALAGYTQMIWSHGNLMTSMRIAAVAYREQEVASIIDRHYLFNPHIYRVQQHFGVSKWQALLQETQVISLKELFQEVYDSVDEL